MKKSFRIGFNPLVFKGIVIFVGQELKLKHMRGKTDRWNQNQRPSMNSGWMGWTGLLLLLLLFFPILFSCTSCGEEATPSAQNGNPSFSSASEEQTGGNESGVAPSLMSYSVVQIYPHDSTAFTQGLFFHDGQLYEGTGSPEPYRSSLRIADLTTGTIKKKIDQGNRFFGEGIVLHKDTLYQLTWTSRVVYRYHPRTLKLIDSLGWNHGNGQLWGAASDGSNLFFTDGSSNIYKVNSSNMQILEVIGVTDVYGPVNNLNELEFVDRFIYANQWQTNYILKIDPISGNVVGKADLSGILAKNTKEDLSLPKYTNESAVLNGIAYNKETGNFYVTGKLWPYIFEIRFN
jgi:glutamine cyclotransferase